MSVDALFSGTELYELEVIERIYAGNSGVLVERTLLRMGPEELRSPIRLFSI